MMLQWAPRPTRARIVQTIVSAIPQREFDEWITVPQYMLDRNYLRNKYQTDLSSDSLPAPVRP
jgi:hypothetical protein